MPFKLVVAPLSVLTGFKPVLINQIISKQTFSRGGLNSRIKGKYKNHSNKPNSKIVSYWEHIIFFSRVLIGKND